MVIFYLSPVLWTGIMFTFFHSFGKKNHSLHYYLKEYLKDLRLTLHTALTSVLRFHHSRELCLDPMNIIVSLSMLKSESLVTISKTWLWGRELSFLIGLHCSLKNSLNRFGLTKESGTNSLFTRRSDINGICQLSANVLFQLFHYI